MWDNIITAAVLVLIIGGAITYIVKAKKRGQKCIGCPHSGSCGSCDKDCSCSEKK